MQMFPAVALLVVGSEVTKGYVQDAHVSFFAEALQAEGMELGEARILPDHEEEVKKAILDLHQDFFIIMTGGLGPTEDDKTVDIISELLSVEPTLHPPAERRIRAVFRKKDKNFLKRALRQGRIPSGVEVIENKIGLAPGFFAPSLALVALPGFPLEVKPMWETVRDILQKHVLQKPKPIILPIWGIGESDLFSQLEIPEEVEVGVHALPYGCRLFVQSNHSDVLRSFTEQIQEKFSACIMENPEQSIFEILKSKKETLAFAESCTGGLAGKIFTDMPGSSEVFLGSLVCYHNSVKKNVLNVKESTLIKYGAVSQQTALEMAEGARKNTGATYAISWTGIAGPTGGSLEKPVGTLFCAVAKSGETRVAKFLFPLGRKRFRLVAVYAGYLGLLSMLKGHSCSRSAVSRFVAIGEKNHEV